MKRIVVAIVASVGFGIFAWASVQTEANVPGPNQSTAIQVGTSYHNDVSPPWRDMAQAWFPVKKRHERATALDPKIHDHQAEALDSVIQNGFQHPFLAPSIPSPILNFDGMQFGVGGNSVPPHTDGAVGLTQYVQTVNEAYRVFDKATGASVFGPASVSSLWSGFGGVCQSSGTGEPVVLYDDLANRWLISQLAGSGAPTDQCVAISTSSDATGTYHRYAFHLGSNFFERPRLGIWPDGYYMAINVFNSGGTAFLGPQAFAFDRAAMLAGAVATFVTPGITGGAGEPSFQPSDIDGLTTPPAGTGNPFVSFPGTGTYKVRLFHADFVTPGNTTFNLIGSPAAAGFTMLCPTTVACVPQPNGTALLDGLGRGLMVRLAYRSFPDHDSVVGNYAVSANGVAGIRWFELRSVTNGPVTVYQESTYQPDATWRWTGSAAMDRNGNLALGFSASSSTVNPSIRYTGRLVGDPLNTLPQGEAILMAGGGSQTGSSGWGSYSSMTVDPVDDCTFWYTNEYYETTSPFGWRTRIGNFKFKECTTGPPTPTPTIPPTPTPTLTPTPTASPCTVINGSLAPGDTTQGNHVTQQYPGGTCAAPYTCPGLWVPGTYRFDEHHFTNTSGAPQCIDIAVTAPGLEAGDLWCQAFSPIYDPANLCVNFLGQGGQHYSVTVPADQTFSVILTDMHSVEERTFPYTLYVGSCSVPTPTPTPPPTPTPYPTITPTPPPSQALNISTRLRVETGDRVMIGGFIITGNAPKKVAIRAIGPSLSNLGLSDVLADPTLELRGSDGALLRQNDNWQDDPVQAAQLTALGLALEDPNESGIVATLPPGAYTAIMAGKNQTTGIGLVELYDAEVAAASQLANISTRGFVRTADNVMIGGFILGGSNAGASVAIRGIGPSLSQVGLGNVLADPTVELHDGNGALLVSNDDWQDDPASAEQLTAYGLAPTDAKESAIFATLPPGAFTAILAGKDGGVGLGLLEIYGDVHGETLTVTSTADSGAGSLRDTIAAASSGDTIQFAAALNGETIGLTSGELVIDKNITISGLGPTVHAVSRTSGAFRIFHIMAGHIVRLEGLKISGGFSYESGGGIFNEDATLTLDHCAVEGNYSGGFGGGGIYSPGNNAVLTVLNSTIDGNLNPGMHSGTGGQGAGIFSSGRLTITSSSVSGNSVYTQPPRPGRTGGIFSSGNAEISRSSVGGNMAGTGGGGITNAGPMIITDSSVSYNTSVLGGCGGGIENQGTLEIRNSTVSGNRAVFKGSGFGGGICNGETLIITNSTITGNSADGQGGGISTAGGTLEIANTILNAGAQGANIGPGMVTSHGYNLSSDNGGGFLTGTGDQINTNPMLGALLSHGGPTATHALLTGSPAINAGDPNFTPPPLYDQRGLGYDRVVNGRIDIGSFEVPP